MNTIFPAYILLWLFTIIQVSMVWADEPIIVSDQNESDEQRPDPSFPTDRISKETKLRRNKEILKPLSILGSMGELIFNIMTHPRILGREISEFSSAISTEIGYDMNKELVKDLIVSINKTDVKPIFDPFLKRVQNVTDPVSKETVGTAALILFGSLQNPESKEEFQQAFMQSDEEEKYAPDVHAARNPLIYY